MALAGDGTTVVAWKCSPGATASSGPATTTARCGSTVSAWTSPVRRPGATVKAAACTGAASQTWAIGQVSANDFGPITNIATGNALNDPAGSTVNGTRLVMKHGNGDLSGPWRVSYHHYGDG